MEFERALKLWCSAWQSNLDRQHRNSGLEPYRIRREYLTDVVRIFYERGSIRWIRFFVASHDFQKTKFRRARKGDLIQPSSYEKLGRILPCNIMEVTPKQVRNFMKVDPLGW